LCGVAGHHALIERFDCGPVIFFRQAFGLVLPLQVRTLASAASSSSGMMAAQADHLIAGLAEAKAAFGD
jgi:hypothetical protein